MSQFQTQPPARFPRPRFDLGAPLGPTVGVQPVGLPEPVVERDPVSDQLGNALDAATQGISLAGHIADRNAQQAQIQAARDERRREIAANLELRKISVGAKNTAAQTARELIPQTTDLIKSGGFQFAPEDKNDPELAVARIVREQTDNIIKDLPDEHKPLLREAIVSEFDRVYSPRILQALYQKAEADDKLRMKTALGGLSDRLHLSNDPADLAPVMTEAAFTIPNVTDEQLDGVLARTMLRFAKDNRGDLVDGAKKLLKDRAVEYQDQADALLMTSQARAEAANIKGFADVGADWQMRVSKQEASLQEAKKAITDEAKARGLGNNALQTQVQPILDAIEREHKEQLKKQVLETELNTLKAATTSRVSKVLADGDSPNGFSERIVFEQIPGVHESVGSARVQKDLFLGEARRQAGVNFDNVNAADTNNTARWARYIRGLSSVGVVDDDLQNRLLALDFNTSGKNGEQKASQRNTLNAQTYLMVHAINPVYAERLVSENAAAKKFYDNLVLRQRAPGAVNADQLVLDVAAFASTTPAETSKPGEKDYDAILKQAPGLTPSLVHYAVRTLNDQRGMNGALDFAVEQARSRGVQLWSSWAGWANPIVPFTRSNNSPTRPYVELGPLATNDEDAKKSIAKAMQGVLTDTAEKINKADPTLKMDPDDFRLNYTGNGVWEIEGIPAGRFNETQDNRWFVTDAEIRKKMQTLAPAKESIDELRADLAKTVTALAEADKVGTDPTFSMVGEIQTLLEQKRRLESKIKVHDLMTKRGAAQ